MGVIRTDVKAVGRMYSMGVKFPVKIRLVLINLGVDDRVTMAYITLMKTQQTLSNNSTESQAMIKLTKKEMKTRLHKFRCNQDAQDAEWDVEYGCQVSAHVVSFSHVALEEAIARCN